MTMTATMTMTVSDTYDTLQDLSQNEREKLEHWERQFTGTHAARRLSNIARVAV